MPPSPDFQLAVAAYRQGQFAVAERHCREGLKGDPHNPSGLQLLAVAQLRQGDAEAAVDTFDRLLRLVPNAPDALMNRALALQQLGRLTEALENLDLAVRLRPDYAEALGNRSSVLIALGRFPEALESAGRALVLAPNSVTALFNHADALRLLGRYQEALAGFDRLVKLQPATREALVGVEQTNFRATILEMELRIAEWSNYDATVADLSSRQERGEAINPFVFSWWNRSAEAEARCAETWAKRTWRTPQRPLPPCPRYDHDRIRVAYLSPDFREHPISYVFAGMIERHDRSRFEVSALSCSPGDGSTIRARLERSFDRFHDVSGLGDRAFAELIRHAEIDIVVDLAGYTAGNRGNALALRPAPLTVNFQGFGTWSPFEDYLMLDRRCVLAPFEHLYREKIAYMPGSWMMADNREPIAADTPSRAAQGLPERGFVFCSFNGASKIMPQMFDAWMRLLRAVEGSVLWLRHDNALADANLRKQAERRGISGDRLIFARRLDLSEHLARHRLADLFLDTFPFGAHTTASHALWAGLPVLTLRGETFVSRVGSSLLAAVGLPEMIVDSLAAYEALALELALDPGRLGAVRGKLAQGRATAPLFDSDRFVRQVESAYTIMLDGQRRGAAPASFDVPAL